MDGEHYLIEPSQVKVNTSDSYQSAQAIPHILYSLKHSQKHSLDKINGSDSSSCAVNTGKLLHVYCSLSGLCIYHLAG